MKNGDLLPADLLVIAAGIRPQTDLAVASNIPVNRGVIVNDVLATAVAGVFALGECAEHKGIVYGIVPPIWEQSEVMSDAMIESPSEEIIPESADEVVPGAPEDLIPLQAPVSDLHLRATSGSLRRPQS